jgi:hypothetical protein
VVFLFSQESKCDVLLRDRIVFVQLPKIVGEILHGDHVDIDVEEA